MKMVFRDKRIAGVLSVLPEREIRFEDEISHYTFPAAQTLRLKKVMGYDRHRIAKPETATSDLCVFGLNHLLSSGRLSKDEIGAIVVVTITPDHFVPHVSNIIHGRCEFASDVLCMDLAQGCCGFELGLMQSFLLLEHLGNRKVLLFNADVLSHRVSPRDRNSYPLVGDAAALTVVENSPNELDIHFRMEMDGTRCEALMIPAGGSRLPCTAATAEMKDDGNGNFRALDHMRMDGTAVFQFVQTDVPPLIKATLADAGISREQVDYWLFHQPNRFMLRKLAEKLGVPYEKMPMNVVEQYGNPSGASIPLAMTHNLSRELCEERHLCCLSAFGGGLTWCAMTMDLGEMRFCDTLVSPY